ncbi:MAG: hypothetical protein ACYTG3_01290 [Planctomycetota bacterium]|jgi:hypothetical protein
MRPFAPACLLLIAFLSGPTVGNEPTTEGAHFRVILHFEANGLEQDALRQVEAIWKLGADLYGLSNGRLRRPLDVHLYRDAAAYEVAEAKLTRGAFRRNLAFAHHETRSAHVALQPPMNDRTLAAVGLPYLTRSLLLHEAAHLVRYHAMANYRSHPHWLADGAAMWLKHRVLAESGTGSGEDAEPLSATYVVRIRRLLDAGRLPSVTRLLADEIDDLPFYTRYGTRWLFFRYLQEHHARKVRRFLREVRRLGGGPGFGREVTALLSRELGKRRFAALDDGFHHYLRSLEPEWEEVLRSLSGNPTRCVSAAFPQSNAVAWQVAPVGKPAYVLEGTVEILPNTERQLNVLLDRSEKGFVCVALNADHGVTLFEYEAARSQWHRRGAQRHALALHKPFRVRVEVRKGRVDVSIDGRRLLGADFPARTLDGAWGLGALAGSAGIWRGFGLRLP